jgi:hypothetical protein
VQAANGPTDSPRIVIALAGEPAHGKLVESTFVEKPFVAGGEHNMYELAFAAAALGLDVELRGWLDRLTFDRLVSDVGAAPRVELEPRLPEPDDLVVVPEGWRDPLEYGRLLLSPAQLAMYVLAPPGLFGWPFTVVDWTPPDPLTVPLDAVARPEHFQALHALGIGLLTHSPGIVSAAEAAGVPCAFVGTGRPVAPQPPSQGDRPVDAVGLLANRWAPLVKEVARDLEGVHVDLVGQTRNDGVLERFAQARVLIWPSRIEGHATIPWEARTVGCVPVALSSNRFAVGLSEEKGALVVDRVEDIAPAVRALLGDRDRWRELSRRAMESAPEEVRWDGYVSRADRFFRSPRPEPPQQGAYAGIGSALRNWMEERGAEGQRAREDLVAELERVRHDRDALHAEEALLRADRDRIARELDAAKGELAALYRKPAIKLALRLRELNRKDG